MKSSDQRGDIRIGISGWRYPPWRGVFYPAKLPQKNELVYASRQFSSIEINGTFYALQRPKSFAAWRDATPDNFIFSVKAPRYITHIRRLKDIEIPLANFFASGVLELGQKLGPFLWQFPPSFKFDPQLLEAFFRLLPHNADAAATLAAAHDAHIKDVTETTGSTTQKLRHAIEIRHQSFRDPAFIELLRAYDIALVCADTVEWPRLMDLTADFVYCRLHGSEVLYASGYDAKSVDQWAVRVAAWAAGDEPHDAERAIDTAGPKCVARDVYIYFDNDIKVRAPFDAMSLADRLGIRLASA